MCEGRGSEKESEGAGGRGSERARERRGERARERGGGRERGREGGGEKERGRERERGSEGALSRIRKTLTASGTGCKICASRARKRTHTLPQRGQGLVGGHVHRLRRRRRVAASKRASVRVRVSRGVRVRVCVCVRARGGECVLRCGCRWVSVCAAKSKILSFPWLPRSEQVRAAKSMWLQVGGRVRAELLCERE